MVRMAVIAAAVMVIMVTVAKSAVVIGAENLAIMGVLTTPMRLVLIRGGGEATVVEMIEQVSACICTLSIWLIFTPPLIASEEYERK